MAAGQSVRVVLEVAGPRSPVDERLAARPGAGQLDPDRVPRRGEPVRIDDRSDRAGVTDRRDVLPLLALQEPTGELRGRVG